MLLKAMEIIKLRTEPRDATRWSLDARIHARKFLFVNLRMKNGPITQHPGPFGVGDLRKISASGSHV